MYEAPPEEDCTAREEMLAVFGRCSLEWLVPESRAADPNLWQSLSGYVKRTRSAADVAVGGKAGVDAEQKGGSCPSQAQDVNGGDVWPSEGDPSGGPAAGATFLTATFGSDMFAGLSVGFGGSRSPKGAKGRGSDGSVGDLRERGAAGESFTQRARSAWASMASGWGGRRGSKEPAPKGVKVGDNEFLD